MLSLPLIPPRPDASLWPSHRTPYYFDADSSPSNSPHAHRRSNSHHGHNSNHAAARISILSTLATDENVIEHRKHNVRMFGAGWIRPPGVAKTYQAIEDEKAEQQEQEALARREQVMMDLAAAQQEAANEEARQRGEEMEGMEEERDLDDEVPEAEEAEESVVSASDIAYSSSVGSAESEDGYTGREGPEVTFNEDSFLEGSMVAGEVEHMLEREEAEMAGVLQDERDLDDDIPEAGSYEHTDSELEESSSEEEASLGPGMSSGRRQSGRRSSGRRSSGRLSAGRRSSGLPNAAGRSSFGMDGSSSILEGSSFMRSSPVAPRANNLRDRFLGIARGEGSRQGGARQG